MNIKKILLIRAISLWFSISIALPNTAYSLPENYSNILRVPLNTQEFRERQQEALKAIMPPIGKTLANQTDDANIAKGEGMFTPDEHAEADDVIRLARRERRGYIVQRSKTRISRGWKKGKDEDIAKLKRAVDLLIGEHMGKFGKITLPQGVGEISLSDELYIPNIILIQPRNRSPGLIVKDRNAFQVAHAGVAYNSIYIDKIIFDHLNIEELAALVFHEMIEIKAKSLTLEKGVTWTAGLAMDVHQLAGRYEMEVVGPSPTGVGSRLDDKIREVLQSAFAFRIQSLIEPYVSQLQPLIDRYHHASEKKDREGIEKEINEIVNKINIFSNVPEDQIVVAEDEDIETLDKFLKRKDAEKYIEQAKDAIVQGRYIPEFFFAGAATRLIEDLKGLGMRIEEKDEYKYRMYPLDPWDFAGPARADSLNLNLGMGQRQLFAYRAFLEKLAKERNLEPRDVIRKQRLILHISEEIAKEVQEDFLASNLLGFDPQYGFDLQNTLFIIQENLPGYLLKDGQIILAKDSKKLPFGHGYATMQVNVPSAAFRLIAKDGKADPEYLLEDALAELGDGDCFIGTHRVNDLTKFLVDEVVDIQKLAFSIYLIEQGKDLVVELVENPIDQEGKRQKGGNLVKDKRTNRKFLIETANTSGSAKLDAMLTKASQEGAPYNAFRLTYGLGSLKRLLKKDLSYNLRFKNGYFYLEAVTGDLTQSEEVEAVAFKKEGEVIKDFKRIANLDITIPTLIESDKALIGSFSQLKHRQALSNGKIRELIRRLRSEGIPIDFIDTVILSMPLEHTSADTVSVDRLNDQVIELYDLMKRHLENPEQIQYSVKNPKDTYYRGVPEGNIPHSINYSEIMVVSKDRPGILRDIQIEIAKCRGSISSFYFSIYEGIILSVYEVQYDQKKNAFNGEEIKRLESALSQIKVEEGMPLIWHEYRFGDWSKNEKHDNIYAGEVVIGDKDLNLQVEKYKDGFQYFLTYKGETVGYSRILFGAGKFEIHYLEIQDWFRKKVADVSLAKLLMNIMIKDLLLIRNHNLSGLTVRMAMAMPGSIPKVNNLIGDFGITGFDKDYVRAMIMDKESNITIKETEAPEQGVPYFEVRLGNKFPVKVFLKASEKYSYKKDKRTWIINRRVYEQIKANYTVQITRDIWFQGRLKEELVRRLEEGEVFVGGVDYHIDPDRVEELENYAMSLPINPWSVDANYNARETPDRFLGRNKIDSAL